MLNNIYLRIMDKRRLEEESGERVVFNHLNSKGYLKNFAGKRILEIGSKHCQDSFLLAGLSPKELILLDLPEKDSMVKRAIPDIEKNCKTVFYQGNLLFLPQEQRVQPGAFDLIFCLGVLNHNVE